jgi:hypothetical protein
MRLLRCSNTGVLSFSKNFAGKDAIPPYAILSHTWGADAEEVTFEDLTKDIGKDKAGFKKIQFCGEQAERDNLEYFWVDTCCIDKKNAVELSKAINSMFRWYQKAARCYVFLSDVSVHDKGGTDQQSGFVWEPTFRMSRWFTRGWTLQELIAPTLVDFFSNEGIGIGNKLTMEAMIRDITRIARNALKGDPLSDFSVNERMSWAKHRHTKHEEDEVYSLLGIFEVSMPLIYGEGKDRALRRLQDEIHKSYQGRQFLTLLVLEGQNILTYFM